MPTPNRFQMLSNVSTPTHVQFNFGNFNLFSEIFQDFFYYKNKKCKQCCFLPFNDT